MSGLLNREKISIEGWQERIFINQNIDFDLQYELYQLNKHCSDIDEELQGAGLGIGFSSKISEIDQLIEFQNALWSYLKYIPEDIRTIIDEPLYTEFNNALNYMATIDMSKISIDNTIGLMGLENYSGGRKGIWRLYGTAKLDTRGLSR